MNSQNVAAESTRQNNPKFDIGKNGYSHPTRLEPQTKEYLAPTDTNYEDLMTQVYELYHKVVSESAQAGFF